MKELKVTNPDKILFSNGKITKLELVNYYAEISSLMFPFLKNRPLSLVRCHSLDGKDSFYKRHPSGDKNFEEIFEDNTEQYIYLKNEYQIAGQAQMGTIEFHTWGSKIENIDFPDIMVFDLDPDKSLSLEKLTDAVLIFKNFLDELGLVSFLKTSGKKGYHIVLPFSSSVNYDKFSDFAKNIAVVLTKKYPKIFTDNIKISSRKGKIFIDYLRNKKTSTCAAPYSVRVSQNATISMPISWENLKKILPNEINIRNYKKYLNNSWDNFFKIKQVIKV